MDITRYDDPIRNCDERYRNAIAAHDSETAGRAVMQMLRYAKKRDDVDLCVYAYTLLANIAYFQTGDYNAFLKNLKAAIRYLQRSHDELMMKSIYNEGAGKKIVLVDCGVKANIIRCLINRGVEVIRVPWNCDYTQMAFDGLFLANGPGDPDKCVDAVEVLKKQMSQSRKPICGICMGNQLLAKAGGATIYKLKYGHRSHNQPVREVGTNRCYVTSQNHGYAVDASTLCNDWRELFVNMNDGSNEGIRHQTNPWFSSQFHPEACSGPVDTEFMFDRFIEAL